MSKRDKLLQEMHNNPRDIRFETIQKVLTNHGFSETSPGSGSSHYTYHKDIYRITVPKSNPVNQIYIKQILRILEKLESEK